MNESRLCKSVVVFGKRLPRGAVCLRAVAVLLLVLALLGGSAHAATSTWTGGDNGTAWATDNSSKKNWGGTAFAAGNDAIFAGTTGLAPTIGTTALTAGSITFTNTAGAFTIGGTAALTINGGVVNNDGDTQTFPVPITLGAAQTWNAASGNLNFSGTINNAGFLLTIDGANNTAISGVISSTGGLTKSGAGTLTLSGANTYTGGTTLSQGTLRLGAANALGGSTSAFNFAGGILDANNQTASIGALSLTASSTLNLTADSTPGTLTFSSTTWTAGTLTINGWTGTAWGSGTDDRIFITANPGAAFLNNVNFIGFSTGATWLGTGEIVPVLEPINVALGVFGVVFVGFRLARRLRARRPVVES